MNHGFGPELGTGPELDTDSMPMTGEDGREG